MLDSVALRPYLVKVPEGIQVVIGQGLFSPLTVEELFRTIAIALPTARFGVAMVEGSTGVVRHSGNDDALRNLAASHALGIGAGHSFIILLQGGFPTQVLPHLRQVPSVVNLYVATGNAVTAIVADLADGAAVLAIVDGQRATHIEDAAEISNRRRFVREVGYLEPE